MKALHWGVLAVTIIAAAPATAAPEDLALKRVMLSTGGVAYLEFEAEVTGNAELRLDVPLDQVDDVLKSIVVYDSKGASARRALPAAIRCLRPSTAFPSARRRSPRLPRC